MVRQGELIQEIGSLIAGGAPGDWTQVVLDVKAVGSYGEAICHVTDRDGTVRTASTPDGLQPLVLELRSVMYRSGAGTWFSMTFMVIATSPTSARSETAFNYDDMPDWHSVPAPVTFVEDLQQFPRDSANMPGWLTEQVELAGAEYPEMVERLGIKFYREVLRFPGGREQFSAVFRREVEGDVRTDSVFYDNEWHYTVDLMMALRGVDRMRVRQVSPMNARAFLDKNWGAGTKLYAPMVIDAYEKREDGGDEGEDGTGDVAEGKVMEFKEPEPFGPDDLDENGHIKPGAAPGWDDLIAPESSGARTEAPE